MVIHCHTDITLCGDDLSEVTTVRVLKSTLETLEKLRDKLKAKVVTGDEHFKNLPETIWLE